MLCIFKEKVVLRMENFEKSSQGNSKSKKSLWIIILSIALTVSLCTVAVLKFTTSNPDDSIPPIEDSSINEDSPVTVYLLTSKTASDGEIYTYSYDEKGNMFTGSIETANNECTYNQQGNITSNQLHDGEYFYNSDGSIDYVVCTNPSITYRYSYDNRGNLISVDYEDKNNVTWNKATYVYDSQNRLIRESLGDSAVEQTLYRVSEFSYDKNQLIEVTTYTDPEKKVNIRFKYDRAGRPISREVFSSGISVCSTICEYNLSGQLTQVTKYGDINHPFITSVYTLHYENDLLSTIDLCRYSDGEDSNEVDYTILFDTNGNPIRKLYKNGSSAEYEYTAKQMSAQYAQRYKQVQFIRKGIGYAGELNGESFWGHYGFYGPTTEFRAIIPYPVTAMYEIDLWEHFLRN